MRNMRKHRIAKDSSDLDESDHLLARPAKSIDPASATQGEWDELKSEEEEAIQINSVRRAEIIDSPACIFQKRDLAHDEITLAFQGPGSPQAGRKVKWLSEYTWPELFDLARFAQEAQLRSEGRPAKQIKTLLRGGWAWAWSGILRKARENTWATKQVPKESGNVIQILFRYTGYAWVVPEPLRTLAELKLGVRALTEQKNDTRRADKAFSVSLAHASKEAAFYCESPDPVVRSYAAEFHRQCEGLRRVLSKGEAEPFFVAWEAREIGKSEQMLQTLADREMLEENVKAAVFGKGQSKGELRLKVEPFWTQLHRQGENKPTIRQVVQDMGGSIKVNSFKGKIIKTVVIPGCDPHSYDAFSETLARIAEDHRKTALKSPEPRKSKRRRD
jgi:hypothetical protein